MAQFKGTIYETARLYTERRFGHEGVTRVLGQLQPEAREALLGATAVGWYPVEPVLEYHRELDRLYGRGDLALCEQVGEFSAEWALNTVLKFFLRFRSPHWLLERSSSLWERYHDSGRWELITDTTLSLRAQLHDFQVRDAAFCARFRGWLRRAIELTGGHDAEVQDPACACQGDAFCEFTATWR